jgi:hypothetical protein
MALQPRAGIASAIAIATKAAVGSPKDISGRTISARGSITNIPTTLQKRRSHAKQPNPLAIHETGKITVPVRHRRGCLSIPLEKMCSLPLHNPQRLRRPVRKRARRASYAIDAKGVSAPLLSRFRPIRCL